jgi:hypothetical protein
MYTFREDWAQTMCHYGVLAGQAANLDLNQIKLKRLL